MFEIFLVFSVFLNVMFFLYCRWLIRIIKTKEEDIDAVSGLISQYVTHVDSVHEMEMFYGDPTLASLIQHGKEIVNKIDTLDYVVLEEDIGNLPTEQGEVPQDAA